MIQRDGHALVAKFGQHADGIFQPVVRETVGVVSQVHQPSTSVAAVARFT